MSACWNIVLFYFALYHFSLLKQSLRVVHKNSSFEVSGQKPSKIMKQFSFLTKVQTSGLQNIGQNSEFRDSYFQKTFFSYQC